MEIDYLFGPENEYPKGLWAARFGNEMDELQLLEEMWEDPEQIETFCHNHLEKLKMTFGDDITVEKATTEIMEEAQELLELLEDAGMKRDGAKLQFLFRPLDNREASLVELQLSKGSAKSRWRKNPKLRIYAIRIDEDTYVLTGGAIKLTYQMEEAEATREELDKLKNVKRWLKNKGIIFSEDLTDLS